MAHNERYDQLLNVKDIQLAETNDTTGALATGMSGAIFVSGGALCYEGFGGSISVIAAS